MPDTEKTHIRHLALQFAQALYSYGAPPSAEQLLKDAKLIEQYLLGEAETK